MKQFDSTPEVKKLLISAEVLLASLVVIADVFVPTLVLLTLLAASLIIRKKSIISIGLKRPASWKKLVPGTLGLSVLWTLITFGFTLPILMRITGEKQDLGPFLTLQGNFPQLVILLVLSWTLAAIGEEIAYRGYLFQRTRDLFGNSLVSTLVAITLTSLLFGFAHSEQGRIGIVVTAIDAVFFSLVKLKYNNLWAAILVHGFNNTIGIITFYLLGPMYSLW